LRGRVTALAVSAGTWFATTPQGVFRSADGGQSWQGPVLGDPNAGFFSGVGDYVAITSSGSAVYAARRNGIVTSVDGGVQWEPVIFPSGLTAVEAMAASPDGTLWAGGREGLFFTTDRGRTWTKLSRLPLVAINSLAWDPSMRRVIVTSRESTVIFAIDPRDRTWKWWNAGWNVHSVAWSGGRLMAASLFSGIVAQPALETASAGGNMAQNAQR
ncbi:MAG: transcriptional regulator, partial [Acidobacteriaceae bacterium]